MSKDTLMDKLAVVLEASEERATAKAYYEIAQMVAVELETGNHSLGFNEGLIWLVNQLAEKSNLNAVV